MRNGKRGGAARQNIPDWTYAQRTGLLIPLYIGPGPAWSALIRAKHDHPDVTILAVINPCNGPGDEKIPAYAGGIAQMQSSGVTVLGYVHTRYGSRPIEDLKADLDSYRDWYGIDGILFDEMANVPGMESYYANLTCYAKKIGMTITVGNPGMDTLPSYVGTVDNLVLHDNKSLPPLCLFERWQARFPKQNFSFLSYGVESITTDFIISASRYVGYLYLTDKGPNNPWGELSEYFQALVKVTSSDKLSCVGT